MYVRDPATPDALDPAAATAVPARTTTSTIALQLAKRLGEDDLAARFALDLRVDVGAEEAAQHPVVVLPEDDHLRSHLLRRLDDRRAGLPGGPGQAGVDPGCGEPVARL